MELPSEAEDLIRRLKRAVYDDDAEEMDRISDKLRESNDNSEKAEGIWRTVELGNEFQVEVKEMMEFEGDKWGHCIWTAAEVLARLIVWRHRSLDPNQMLTESYDANELARLVPNVEGLRILELGAGCHGLASLTCAKFDAAYVACTDCVPQFIESIKEHIDRLEESEGSRCNITPLLLDWEEDVMNMIPQRSRIDDDTPSLQPSIALQEAFDVIFGSDILLTTYNSSILLPKVVAKRLSRPNGRAIFVCGVRGKDICELFLSSLAEEGLHVEKYDISSEVLLECNNGCDNIRNIQNYAGGMVLFFIHW